MIFLAHDWTEISNKVRLHDTITGIKSLLDWDGASVTEKLSWAAKRQTIRVEDKAYCLLGFSK